MDGHYRRGMLKRKKLMHYIFFQTFAWHNLTYIFDIVVGYVPGEITLGQQFSEPIPEELHEMIIQKYHDYYSPRLWNNKALD